jgi:hypothetical protein
MKSCNVTTHSRYDGFNDQSTWPGCASIGERSRNIVKSLQAVGIVANMSNPYIQFSPAGCQAYEVIIMSNRATLQVYVHAIEVSSKSKASDVMARCLSIVSGTLETVTLVETMVAGLCSVRFLVGVGWLRIKVCRVIIGAVLMHVHHLCKGNCG